MEALTAATKGTAGTAASRCDYATSPSTSSGVLKAVPYSSCGSEALGRARRMHVPFDGNDVVGFYPITQSATAPIVRFDAMSRVLVAHDRSSQTRRSTLGPA